MGEIRNRIITISGEPVSGKSTVVKILKEKYEKLGYNVHIISTGHIFREVITKEYLKMYPDRVNANLADIQTDESFAQKRNEVDHMIDAEMAKKGQEINSQERPNDVYIIDSRLAWKNIPDSFAIRLTIDENIAGQRAFADETRGAEDRYETVEDAINKTRQRKLGEIERYKKRYGVDLTDHENYRLLVNTSYSNTEELADIIIKGETCYRIGKYFPKHWKSPALFLPTQNLRETISRSPFGGNTMEDIAQSIREIGYDYTEPVIVNEVNDITLLQNGHHRCIGAIAAGKTLVPYEPLPNPNNKYTEQSIYSQVRLSDIYDWEEMIRWESKQGNIESLQEFDVTKLSFMRKYLEWLQSRDER